jgi:hypothetical protein
LFFPFCNDIAEILLKLALNTNQLVNPFCPMQNLPMSLSTIKARSSTLNKRKFCANLHEAIMAE